MAIRIESQCFIDDKMRKKIAPQEPLIYPLRTMRDGLANYPEEVRSLYDGVANRYEEVVGRTKFLGREWLNKNAIFPKYATVLDLGCANGINLRGNIEISRAVGVDISPKMIEIAKSSGIYQETYVHDLDFSLSFLEANEIFDLVFAIGFTEFLNRPSTCLSEIRRLLKPQGMAYVTFQEHVENNPLKPRQTHSGSVQHFAYTQHEVSELIRNAGLKLAKSESMIGYVSGTGFQCPYVFAIAVK